MTRYTFTLCLLFLLVSESLATSARAEETIRFETHILPILQTRCIRCHGEKHVRGGLDLRRKFTMLKGGDSGPSLVPGQPKESLLFSRVANGEMPPAKEETLSPRHVELLRLWVQQGAKLENPKEAPLEDSAETKRISDEDRQFWAFQPPKRPAIPHVRSTERIRTAIDAFVLSKLEAKGLTLNADASREVMLRRLCFDLVGLPPTLEQRNAFLSDTRPDAYERLVDKLLDSPGYGERWGRHWLDIAGYADSDGYLAADRLRPEAWRYRDYVIEAHNADLPYNRFLCEQLAGDEMSDWRRAEALTPEMKRQLTATGFLRTALDPTYPGYTEPNEIHQVLSDTMQIVSSTCLGLTVQCARCHAHKFDPISLRDYYAMRTIFLPALDPARWQPSSVRGIPLATEAEQKRLQERNRKIDVRVKELNGHVAELTVKYRKKLGQPKAKEADLAARFPEFQSELAKLKAALSAESALKRTPILVRGLADHDDKPPEGRILRRGDYNQPGAKVDPNVPEVLAPVGYRWQPAPGYRTTGRRLAFARWLTNRTHPLTARVQVNRMWAHHFGKGIVPTVANFGRSEAKPTHPELLDWLAVEFVERGWSMKRMHRLMVLSSVYRQSSDVDSTKRKRDPANELLGAWRPRRHEGEVLRDSILAVAGKLNGQRLGPPVPVRAKPDGSVETAENPQSNRRSIYLIVRRSQHLTLLDLFDTPMMEVNCPQRTVSTAPLQALALLHGPFLQRNASALAERILQQATTDERIAFVCRLLFVREPRPKESERIRTFLDDLHREGIDERSAWTQVALVLLNRNEFVYVH